MQGVGPGSVLGGRYAVTLRTSEGTHHERWRANDHTLEREVVLVCFSAAASVAAAALDAARRAAGIEDPRLVRVLDVGTDQGVGFIAEEPLTGAVPLSHLLQSGGLAADEVRRLTGEAATALDRMIARNPVDQAQRRGQRSFQNVVVWERRDMLGHHLTPRHGALSEAQT